MTNLELTQLLDRLIRQGKEGEWLEFKHNHLDKEGFGERVSALSNGANLHSEPFGYLVFGVEDGSLKVVGTSFSPKKFKVGNEELEHWLLQRLSPRIDIRLHEFDYHGMPVVLVQIAVSQT